MNKSRRKEIDSVISEIESIQEFLVNEDQTKILNELQLSAIGDLASTVENIRDEEQEYLDNMPENLQNSERYYAAEEAVSNLESALDSLQGFCEETTVNDINEALNDVITNLSDAAQ